MKFEFIHCGDLHLGCYPNHLEERFNDFFTAFNNVIDYAITNQIYVVLIAGDLFHLKNINSRTLQRSIEIFNKAKDHNIEIIAIEGNHDRAFYIDEESWLYFLNKQNYIKLLQVDVNDGKIEYNPYNGISGSVLETDDYRIVGLGYVGGSTETYITELKKALKPSKKFTIVMMHAAVNRLGGQDMGDIKKEVLNNLKDCVNYIALGHIHNRYEYDNFIYNPGSLENIRIKDGINSTQKGFYHVSVEDMKKEIKFIESNPRKIHDISINVTGINTPTEIEQLVLNKEYEFKDLDMVCLRLYGKVNFNPYQISTDIATKIKEKYNLLHIEFSNNINIETTNKKSEETINVDELIKDYIKEDISINFPNVDDQDKIAKGMIDLADEIIDGKKEDLIEKLLKMEVKL